ncbi:hypothetical protein MMPV_001831 [Pyropia vietnamensis]
MVTSAAAAALVSSVTAAGSAGWVSAAAAACEGPATAALPAQSPVLRWAEEPLGQLAPPPERDPRFVAHQGFSSAEVGVPSGEGTAGGAPTTALSSTGMPGAIPSPTPKPTVIPYSLESVHKPHFLASSNMSSCSASSVTSVAHLEVPNRPGVFFIPHSLVRMDGVVCAATRAPLPPYSEALAKELLASPGTLVTRRSNVATEAAAIAAGVEDLWAPLSLMKNAMVIINYFTFVDLWVGVERDHPRVCRGPRMAKGSAFFWFRMLPDESLSIPSIGLELEPNATAVFGVNAEGQRICVWSRTDADTYDPTPPPVQTPAEEPNRGFRSCFPAAATVTRADGSSAVMADVSVGDSLRVSTSATVGDGGGDGGATFSRVYMFAHRLAGGTYDFLELTTSDAARPTLTLSPGHLLYLADGRRVAAARVVPGDRLQPAEPLLTIPATLVGGVALRAAPGTAAAVAAAHEGMVNQTAGGGACALWPPTAKQGVVVTRVTRVRRVGLYNPMTLHGDLIVDGYRVSTFTTDVHPLLATALLAPARALYYTTGWSTGVLEGGVPPLVVPIVVVASVVGAAAAASAAVAVIARGWAA